MLSKQLINAAAGAGGEVLGVEDVFSTWLYTGNGSTQTITNGIDLAGEGGLVWTKNRSAIANHFLIDSARNNDSFLISNTTGGEASSGPTFNVTFNSDGFTDGLSNRFFSGANIASWTFRKAAKFFDVVTYTGTGSNRTIAHNLGSVPGCIIVKRTDITSDWSVYHRGVNAGSGPQNYVMLLNTTAAQTGRGSAWNDTAPTSTVFSLGTHVDVNASGGTYVAYLFAHDAGGFGDSGDESVIKCGSYTGASGLSVNLGWEPQWLLVKNTSSAIDWVLLDTMRNFSETAQAFIYPNASAAETATGNWVAPTATGFRFLSSGDYLNQTGDNYIYIAIRRGPMKTPTVGTSVFEAKKNITSSTAFSLAGPPYVDFIIDKRNELTGDPTAETRLLGNTRLFTNSTNAESGGSALWSGATGTQNITPWNTGDNHVAYLFRRAPGFFDVVAYTGDGIAGRTVAHNLGVTPELMIVKSRSITNNWMVYVSSLGPTYYVLLEQTSPAATPNTFWDDTAPSSTEFTVGSPTHVNGSGSTYIAYLFATCPGVSKVGSYTGSNGSLHINCGFTSGARFVLIKRTDSSGDWYVWDTARGIVTGNDPYLLLNSTAAEVTSTDYIDPISSGFQISSSAPAAINANGGSYIFLAIA
jgi:hypothetical protein